MASERPTPPDPEKNSYERPPQKSLTLWVLLLPLALLIGTVWRMWRVPNEFTLPPTDDTSRPSKPKPKPHHTPGTVAKAPTAAPKLPAKVTVFVPDDDARLQPQTIVNPVSKSSGDSGKDYLKVADAALKALAKKSPDLFPPGSFIGPVQREGDLVKVNLSRKWYEMPQWNQGASFATLAQDSIVDTLAAADGKSPSPIKVQFLQEGKPAELLGELDLSEPISPNTDSVDKS
jgi:hypothetical protein